MMYPVRRRKNGQAFIEAAMLIPILLLLLIGMIELAKVVITYFSLQKAMYSVARYAGTSQGANFCDDADTVITQVKNVVLTGTPEGEGDSLIQGLTAAQVQVRLERFASDSGDLAECACSIDGCDTAAGGRSPDFIVVSLPNGYQVRPVFPLFQVDPIPLRPRVRVPVGGY
jgi:Flp pilus assembly protein TadG